MTTQDVAKQFLKHRSAHTPYRKTVLNGSYRVWNGASFSSDGKNLKSYETVVARWTDEFLQVTARKYSRTTSKQLSILKQECRKQGIAFELVEF